MASIIAKSFFFFLAFLFSIATPLHALFYDHQISPKVESIYQFGDSISDTGNLVRDNLTGKRLNFARLPYGQILHKPTGRCSNGLLMIDYFAEYFKLPYLDAYLNKDGDFSHGVNFAVAGSTALSTSNLAALSITSPVTNNSLSVQLAWFKTHLRSLCSNPSDCKNRLEKSLFIIESGGNDINYALLQMKTIQDVYKIVPEVIRAIKCTAEEVIRLGATQVVIPGNFPIGCLPIYLSTYQTNDLTKYDQLHCLKELNEFAKFQNDWLQQAIVQIQREHPNVTVVYGDYFFALQELLQHAHCFGFNKDETQTACCGKGDNIYNFNSSNMCGSEGVPVCQNPYKRVSWDGVHMTQHAYKIMARWLLKHNIVPSIFKSA